MSSSPIAVTTEFANLPLSPELQKTLASLQFVSATPIQTACIPSAVEGKDIIGIAQTGTGKTFAFGLPLLQRLHGTEDKALIVVPTRELALQVEESLQKVSRSLGTRYAVLIGGASMGQQKNALRNRPHVVIATPGRLIDHMKQRTISLHQTSILVLDEADRMFDMGFAPQVEQIMHDLPQDRQTMLFSATMPDGIAQMVKKYMKLPVRIEIAPQGSIADRLVQEIFIVRGGMKTQLLEKLLSEYNGTVLVFMRTKHAATRISNLIRVMGHSSAELHANRSLAQRKQALQGFKDGRYRVLVATDIAARGIDVSNIELVINYDLPESPEDYVHRIGRTGRAGTAGKAVSFASPDQSFLLKRIERLTKIRLPQSNLPQDLPEPRVVPRETFDDSAGSGFRGGRRSSGGGGGRRSEGGDRSYNSGRPQRSFTPSQQSWSKDSAAAPKDDKVMPSEGDSYSSSRGGESTPRFGGANSRGEYPRRERSFGGDRPSRSFSGEGRRPYNASRGGSSTGDTGGFGRRREYGASSEGSSGGYSRGPSRGGFGRSSSRDGEGRSSGPREGGSSFYQRREGSESRGPSRGGFGRSSSRDGEGRSSGPREGGSSFYQRREGSESRGPSRGGFGRSSSRDGASRYSGSRDGTSNSSGERSGSTGRSSGPKRGAPRRSFGGSKDRNDRNYAE